MTYAAQVRAAKVAAIMNALAESGGCRSEAARNLGLQRTYLWRLIRDLNIPLPPPVKNGDSPAFRRALQEGRVGVSRKRRR